MEDLLRVDAPPLADAAVAEGGPIRTVICSELLSIECLPGGFAQFNTPEAAIVMHLNMVFPATGMTIKFLLARVGRRAKRLRALLH